MNSTEIQDIIKSLKIWLNNSTNSITSFTHYNLTLFLSYVYKNYLRINRNLVALFSSMFCDVQSWSVYLFCWLSPCWDSYADSWCLCVSNFCHSTKGFVHMFLIFFSSSSSSHAGPYSHQHKTNKKYPHHVFKDQPLNKISESGH